MRKHLLRTALLMSALMWPLSAVADTPPNVTGLSAHFENGQVTVRWDAVEGADLYRIYYGQNSILDNEGAYDDFVATSGKNTEFVLADLPPYPQVFLAVLAVNGDGQESASFVEEVQLQLSGEPADGQKTEKEAPTPARREHEATTFGLTSVIAQSPTEVQLTFSTNVSIPVEQAIDAFTIIDNHGRPLRPYRLVIEGSIITITTEHQKPGQDYAVRVNDPVASDPLLGPVLTIDGERSIGVFTGYDGPVQSDELVAQAAASAAPQNISIPRKGLISSGMPVIVVVAVSGAIAGWRRIRRKRRVI